MECILDLSDLKYSTNEDITAFYVRFRSNVCTLLRKKEEKEICLQDDILSPTFEDVIIVWCLEKIDTKLPKQVKNTFGEQLSTTHSLKDLHQEIFKVVPVLLESAEFKDVLVKEIKLEDGPEHNPLLNTEHDQLHNSDWDMMKQEDFIQDDHYDHKELDDDSEEPYCQKCDKTYTTQKLLQIHIAKNHKSASFKCKECGEKFSSKKKLSDHKVGHKLEDYVCEVCDMTFANKTKLKNHRIKVHGEIGLTKEEEAEQKKKNKEAAKQKRLQAASQEDSEPQKCDICGNTYKSEKHLLIHKRRTHTIEPSTCNECGKTFDTRRKLSDHMTSHKIEHCVCEFCDKVFTSKNNLKSHKHNHHMNISCDKCGRIFPSKHRFETHMRKFHNEPSVKKELLLNDEALKEFLKNGGKLECSMCGQGFVEGEAYTNHLKVVHKLCEPEKVPCEICGKLVTTVQMKKHVLTHTEQRMRCETCNRTFISQELMGAHICKHYACDQCDMKFIQNRNLQNHKLEHAGKFMHHCDQCEAMFKKVKSLGEHKRFVHRGIKRYTCAICPRKFAVSSALVNHMRAAHTGEKPYKCDECGASFAQKSGLNVHTRLHTNDYPFDCEVCGRKFRTLGTLKTHREAKLCGFTENDMFKNAIGVEN